jgi:hypothetical protein
MPAQFLTVDNNNTTKDRIKRRNSQQNNSNVTFSLDSNAKLQNLIVS